MKLWTLKVSKVCGVKCFQLKMLKLELFMDLSNKIKSKLWTIKYSFIADKDRIYSISVPSDVIGTHKKTLE